MLSQGKRFISGPSRFLGPYFLTILQLRRLSSRTTPRAPCTPLSPSRTFPWLVPNPRCVPCIYLCHFVVHHLHRENNTASLYTGSGYEDLMRSIVPPVDHARRVSIRWTPHL